MRVGMTQLKVVVGITAIVATAAMAASVLGTGRAEAGEPNWQSYETEKYGFALKLPPEFELHSEDKGATWMYQPGSESTSKSKKKKKKFKVGLRVKGVSLGHETSEEESSSGSGGGLESALTVYVNWVWMPDVASSTLYNANLKQDKQNAASPDPDYTAITAFDKKKGYAHEGNTYWYKEVDKDDGTEIHRWHIKAYGNKSAYTIGLCGTFEQFQKWGPVYEKVIKSFKLVPLKTQ